MGGPFEYTNFAGGFELRAKFEQDAHALVVTVGQRGQLGAIPSPGRDWVRHLSLFLRCGESHVFSVGGGGGGGGE